MLLLKIVLYDYDGILGVVVSRCRMKLETRRMPPRRVLHNGCEAKNHQFLTLLHRVGIGEKL